MSFGLAQKEKEAFDFCCGRSSGKRSLWVVAGAFPIWRRPAPLSKSLAEHSTKQLAAKLAPFAFGIGLVAAYRTHNQISGIDSSARHSQIFFEACNVRTRFLFSQCIFQNEIAAPKPHCQQRLI